LHHLISALIEKVQKKGGDSDLN